MATAGARYTKVSSKKWNDRWYLGLRMRERQLFDYLCENGDNTSAGVYQFDPDVARMKTHPWRRDEFEATCLESFHGHIQFYESNWIWVIRYLHYNGDNMNPDFASGIERIVGEAPPQLQADFWAVYAKKLERFGLPSKRALRGLPEPSDTPSLPPSPSLTSPSLGRRKTSAPDPRVKELQEYFLERSRQHTGLARPPFPWGRSGTHFKQSLGLEHEVKAIKATIDHFFDHWIREKGGGAFSHYQSQYLALCKALQEENSGN